MGGRVGKTPLSALRVKNARAGMHADAAMRGLYLRVGDTGAKSWIFRYQSEGRRRDMGLGPVDLVPLAEARSRVLELRRQLLNGIDPLAHRDAARAAQSQHDARSKWTFRAAAEAVHATLAPGWRNPKHAAQWLATLQAYAYPTIGDKHVSAIGVEDVVAVLSPIWTTKRETGRRVRQRIDSVLDWAVAHGYATSSPVEKAVGLLPKVRREVDHHAALPVDDMPGFWKRLAEHDAWPSVLALRMVVLTAARSGEVRGARWREIDEARRLWTLPRERMKSRREHVVPLSEQAMQVLGAAARAFGRDPGALIFPGPREGRELSDNAFKALLDRLQVPVTAHGFRSTFRDWCSQMGHPREFAERALAHVVENGTEAAYLRTTLIERRRPMMQQWAGFVTGRAA